MSQLINIYSSIKKELRIRQVVEILVLSVVYFITARIGQLIAIPPGNITAVWIPSGIILAAVLLRGYYLWPGVFLGAFFGNTYAYIDLTSFSTAMPAVFSGISNGIGDSLCVVVSAYLIKRSTGEIDPFLSTKNIISFLMYGVLLGPFISALFGITSLCALGLIEWDMYVYSFITWETGDSVGVLLLTPFIISLVQKTKGVVFNAEKVLYALCVIFSSLVILQIIPFQSLIVFSILIPLPLLLWSALKLDNRITCFSVIVFSSVMIVATVLDRGIFTGASLNDKLVQLQLFILTISVTIYIFLGVVSDRNKIHNNLADEIYERKKVEASLWTSKEKYRGIFDESIAAVYVFDREKNFIDSNQAGLDLLGYSREELLGKSISDVDADSEAVAPAHTQLLSGKNIYDYEHQLKRKDGTIITVLNNSKPLTDDQNRVVGMQSTLINITKRKQAEEAMRESEKRSRLLLKLYRRGHLWHRS